MKHFAFYPILFVLAYISSCLGQVKGQIYLGGIIRTILIAFFLALIILIVLTQTFKNIHRAGLVFLLFTMAFLFYGEVLTSINRLLGLSANSSALFVLVTLSGLLFLASSQRFWKLIHFPETLTYYLNIVFIFLLLFQAAQLFMGLPELVGGERTDDNAQSINQAPIKLSGDTQPDIYIIVVDGYARADVLKNIYQYDNTEFLSALEKRGFYIANRSQSNYIQTKFALGSLLNLDYILPLKPSDNGFSYYNSTIANNRVFSLLKQSGYKTISFDSGYTFSAIHNADIYYSKVLPLSEFESFLLVNTPIETLSNILGLEVPTYFTYRSHRERINYIFKTLQNIPDLAGPKVIFAHILSPHPPFVFDRNGNPVEPGLPYQIFDGMGTQGSKEDYLHGYRNQVTFVNNQVLHTVDAILEKSKTPPVIILMGDHGPGSMFKVDMQAPGCLWERTGNLEAFLLPGHISDPQLYSSISPVNSLRLVFNLYFNADLPLLEDKTFLTSDGDPYAMKDITQESRATQSCSSQDTPP
jgi:hypothetical protein